MLERLGQWLYRRRTVVLGVWVLLVVAGAVLGGSVYDRTENPGLRAGVESTVVDERLEADDPGGEQIVVVLSGAEARGTDLITLASQILYQIWDLPGVSEVRDPYTSGTTELFTSDGQGAIVQIEFHPWVTTEQAVALTEQIRNILKAIPFPTVLMGGPLLAQEAFVNQAVQDAAVGEGIALVVLFGILVLILGGWLIGAIPVVTALGAVAVSLLALSGLSVITSVSEFAVNVVTVLGIGLAVDYSLLMLARFREERARAEQLQATSKRRRTTTAPDLAAVFGTTMATAGRTVLISGLTVGTALAALFLLGDPMLTAMAVGGVIAVVVATATGLTLAPALIAVGHSRIPAPRQRSLGKNWFAARRATPGRGILARLAGFAQARPWPTLLASAALLVLLAIPLLSLQVGNSDARSLPEGSESRLVYEAIDRTNPEAARVPITVLVDLRSDDPGVTEIRQQLRELDGVTDAVTVNQLEDNSTVVWVEFEGLTDGEVAQRLVTEIRDLDTSAPILVGGPTAELVDAKAALGSRVLWAILAVVLVTGLLLLRLTGSLVVSVKTIVLNLLSLAATLGVVVAIFQWGWGSSLLGFTPWGALDITTPLLLFMFCFGLSMDYHVFLIARIKEAWDHPETGPDAPAPGSRAANDRAVMAGITSSGPVVTLAALAIIIVFLGFAAGQLTAVKEIGVGMTVAILLDVTIVRGLLLPAAMTLLGQWNWWGPGKKSGLGDVDPAPALDRR